VTGARQTDCFICRKHRGDELVPGGAILDEEVVFASHGYHPELNADAYLGHVVVEPKRHAPGVDDLTDAEAAAVGIAVARLARAIKASEGAEHIYVAVIGHHMPHVHVHLIPRYPGTPREFWDPFRVDDAPSARHGGPDAIAPVAERVRAAL
jgi:histidine triad (HIT) family protein